MVEIRNLPSHARRAAKERAEAAGDLEKQIAAQRTLVESTRARLDRKQQALDDAKTRQRTAEARRKAAADRLVAAHGDIERDAAQEIIDTEVIAIEREQRLIDRNEARVAKAQDDHSAAKQRLDGLMDGSIKLPPPRKPKPGDHVVSPLTGSLGVKAR